MRNKNDVGIDEFFKEENPEGKKAMSEGEFDWLRRMREGAKDTGFQRGAVRPALNQFEDEPQEDDTGSLLDAIRQQTAPLIDSLVNGLGEIVETLSILEQRIAAIELEAGITKALTSRAGRVAGGFGGVNNVSPEQFYNKNGKAK